MRCETKRLSCTILQSSFCFAGLAAGLGRTLPGTGPGRTLPWLLIHAALFHDYSHSFLLGHIDALLLDSFVSSGLANLGTYTRIPTLCMRWL